MSSGAAFETLVDVVARDRRSDAVAVRAPAVDQTYDYHRFCTTAWKAANFLHARGVRERSTVAVADDARTEPILAVLGASLLGARASVGAPRDVDARALVAHVDDVDDYDLPSGSQRIAYGGAPTEPGVYHFEGDVWSENPTIPPEAADRRSTNVAVVSGREARTHGELLAAAADVTDDVSLDEETTVAVRAPLADPRALVAGVLAPLGAGATVTFPDDDDAADGAPGGSSEPAALADVAVVGENAAAPEPRTVSVGDVEF